MQFSELTYLYILSAVASSSALYAASEVLNTTEDAASAAALAATKSEPTPEQRCQTFNFRSDRSVCLPAWPAARQQSIQLQLIDSTRQRR